MSAKFLKPMAVALSLTIATMTAAQPVSAAGLNQTCKKAGAVTTVKSKGKTIRVKCSRVGSKLRWVQVKGSTTPVPAETISQRNASRQAASYLRSSAFSRSGLIEQLEFEGFSLADATYGTDAQKADWNAQAVKKAASYLRTSAFSRTGLIKQLEFEGFSNSESVFGVDGQKADWKEQASKMAASYLKTSGFSRSGLISQLLFEGFTQAEAEYGANSAGL